MSELEGRVALVTGGGRGIGEAIALALARSGACVALTYHGNAAAAARTKAAIEGLDQRCLSIQADVSKAEDVARLVDLTARTLGEVDILVNNAGVATARAIETVTEADWLQAINVNLTSVFLVTQAVLPAMRRRQWGRIINLSSTAAQVGGVVGPHYAASKAGILGLTRSYAAQLAPEGVTVNAIAPALILTEMTSANPRARPDLIPVGRFGHVDEVAEVAVMLARNAYVTGQTLNVNGGLYMS